MNLTRLEHFDCDNNPLELSPQIARFINRINNAQTKQSKCFTGRMGRVVNCLNGFCLVNINIKDSDQIGNISVLIKSRLESANTYTIKSHKQMIKKE
jgi:hypothetical protein